MSYSAYVLTKKSRRKLLGIFTPLFSEVIAEHITHRFPDNKPPPAPKDVQVVGVANNDKIEAVIVSVNGSIRRPDGGIYHITLSLDRSKGAKPFHSNGLLKGIWEHLDDPFSIEVVGKIL